MAIAEWQEMGGSRLKVGAHRRPNSGGPSREQ